MTLTNEEYDFVTDNLEVIERIVKNCAISAVSIDFRDGITKIAKGHKLIDCSHCSTAIYLATTRIYNLYVQERSEHEKQSKNKSKKSK